MITNKTKYVMYGIFIFLGRDSVGDDDGYRGEDAPQSPVSPPQKEKLVPAPPPKENPWAKRSQAAAPMSPPQKVFNNSDSDWKLNRSAI